MFRRSLVAACLILASSASSATAQMSGGGPPPPPPPPIAGIWEQIELQDIAARAILDHFFDSADDAWDVVEAWEDGATWDESAFQAAVANMQLQAGQYAEAVTYSLYAFWTALLDLDAAYLDDALAYIEELIAAVDRMIEELEDLRDRAPEDWDSVLTTDIQNLQSLRANLVLFATMFEAIYGDD